MQNKSPSGYTVQEIKPGHITITNDRCGKPYTRTTPMGMYCSDKPCACEDKDREQFSTLMKNPTIAGFFGK